MVRLEQRIKMALRSMGIECQSVYKMPDLEESRILLSFKSNGSKRLTTRKIEKVLNSLGVGQFEVPKQFQRLSAAFLHLEVELGARMESSIIPSAQ